MSDAKHFFTTFPDADAYWKRLDSKKKEREKAQSEGETLETKKLIPRCVQMHFACHCCAEVKPKIFFWHREQETGSAHFVYVEFEGKEFKVNASFMSATDIIQEVLPLIGKTIQEPKLFLGNERLCNRGEFTLHRDWFFLFLRLRGGGYSNQHLKALTTLEQSKIVDLYGNKEIYHVLPELWSEVSLKELPVRSRYHFVLPTPYPEHIQTAISKYTGNDFLALNLRLNLLNSVVDEHLFSSLMEVSLGSFQLDLPSEVYRYTNLSYEEADFYSLNIGKQFLYKQFLSTSTCSKATQHLGTHSFHIRLKPGYRNGVFHIGSDSQYPTEKEVLLCAYSLYTILSVENGIITLMYNDYYEYNK